MDDDKLAIEEARRAGQHGSVKSQVEGEVQAEIAEHAAQTPPPDSARIGQLAGEFRAKAGDIVHSRYFDCRLESYQEEFSSYQVQKTKHQSAIGIQQSTVL